MSKKRILLGLFASLSTALMINHFQAQLKSVAIRLLSQIRPNPAKSRGIWVDLGAGIPGWNNVSLVGFMDETLPDIVGHPVEAVAFSRFGGFNLESGFSDFQNPNSISYQCWYGAYLVFDNEHCQRFGFEADGTASVQGALDALEADQRLVYKNAGIQLAFEDGRVVKPVGEFEQTTVTQDGQTWHRIVGEAETWSTYHRGDLPLENWKFDWCYGSVPEDGQHGVYDLHRLTYRGEFWVRYEPDWQATCCKFFIYPRFENRYGREMDKGDTSLVAAGQEALRDVRFGQN